MTMDHFTDEQLTQLKKQLLEARQQLRSEIRDELLKADEEQYGDLAGQVHDPADESVADLLVDTNIAVVSRYIGELREVESALQRMEMGSYGLCEECGGDIPFERLRVQPTARRDVEHQERYEKDFGEAKPRL
jgi:RNA polymerase-binding protein DksA